MKQFVSATLIASLLLTAAPITARAAGDPAPAPGVRVSFDRAVAAEVAAQRSMPAAKTPRHGARAAAATQMSGGGGGGGMMVIMLLSTVAGLVGTYYLVKSMRKQTTTAQ
jgi:hypothetical protein